MTKSNSSATLSTSNLYEHPWYAQLQLLENTTTCESQSPPKPKSETPGQTCTKCNKTKLLTEFDFFQTGGGRRTTCKACRTYMTKVRSSLRKLNPPPPSGPCPICSSHTETWILDHCHHTDSFRGYICDRCNRGLGCFQDDIHKLTNALNYPHQHGHQI